MVTACVCHASVLHRCTLLPHRSPLPIDLSSPSPNTLPKHAPQTRSHPKQPHAHSHPLQALVEFFGTLSAEWALECLKELLVTNPQQNLQVVVNIAKEYTEQVCF